MKLTQKRIRKLMSNRRRLGLRSIDEENAGEIQLHLGGNTTHFPVLDALNPSRVGEPEGLSELSSATELVDEMPISQSRESFLVHGLLNTTFNPESNSLLNNKSFTSAIMLDMHPSTIRLYEALRTLDPTVESKADAARFLIQTQQRIKNYEHRGVPADFAVEMERQHGIRAVWLLHGEGTMRTGDSAPGTPEMQELIAHLREIDQTGGPAREDAVYFISRLLRKDSATEQKVG